jgi:hypothetical protein
VAGTFKSTNPFGTGGVLEGQFGKGIAQGGAGVTQQQSNASSNAYLAKQKQGTSSSNYVYKPPYKDPTPTKNSWGGAYGTQQGAPVNKSYSGTSSGNYSGGGGSVSYGASSGGGGGGDSSGGSGGGGGGSFAAPVAAPVMETITIPDAKSDAAYQQQATELARQMADFNAQQTLADNQYTGSYNQTTRKLGRNGDKWDRNLQNGQYGETVRSNEGDFAGRGLYNSGLYAKEQSNIDSDFNNRLGEIDRARGDFRDTAALSKRNMESSQEVVRQQALASAVASIAAKYGVNLDQVGTSVTREKV